MSERRNFEVGFVMEGRVVGEEEYDREGDREN